MIRYLLPAAMTIECIGAGWIYLTVGDWRRAGYYFCAAAITVFVTV